MANGVDAEYFSALRNDLSTPMTDSSISTPEVSVNPYISAYFSNCRRPTSVNDLSVHVAGKTGTAQESRSRPNHALFVCYVTYFIKETVAGMLDGAC